MINIFKKIFYPTTTYEVNQMIEEDKETNPMWIAYRKQQADRKRLDEDWAQLRIHMDYCQEIMARHWLKLPKEDGNYWYLREEPWPCLPISIKPFIT